jgi:cytochrome oxidase Cu insertion factor (SCO1/SenC/PrrC family)
MRDCEKSSIAGVCSAALPGGGLRTAKMKPAQFEISFASSAFKAFAVLLLLALPALAQMGNVPIGVPAQDLPPNLGNVSFEQRLNTQVPLNLMFRNEFGQTVRLGDYFNQGKPVVLTLVYFECPMLCT